METASYCASPETSGRQNRYSEQLENASNRHKKKWHPLRMPFGF
ncbi:hypothetical protein HJ01_01857 [Flavobacterium frigoris PS1]|uniref:Uncharacterized protein n=1 Tax=Flavobacterium frigoris (strain PS1) TaxID=1086011 RepID=H7FT81_FLAFP|nr:hypothetical protein HJ01_01857 [Flavobacterium frigoris PS1]